MGVIGLFEEYSFITNPDKNRQLNVFKNKNFRQHTVQKRPVLWNKCIQNSTNRLLVDKEWENVAMLLKRDKEEVRLKWRNLRDQFRRELKKMRKPRSKNTGDPPISNYRGKWMYFEMLLFLKDTMMQKKTEDCFNNNLVNAEETECKPQDIVNDEDLTVTENSPLTLMSRCSPDVIDIARLSSHNEKFRTARSSLEPQNSEIFQSRVQRSSSRHGFERRRKRKAVRLSDFEENMLELENKKLSILIEKGERYESEIDEDVHFAKSLVPFLRRLNPLRKLVVRNEIQNLLIKELLDESSISSSVIAIIFGLAAAQDSNYNVRNSYHEDRSNPPSDERRGPLTTTPIPILHWNKQQEHDGTYKTSYETGNNIIAEESGYIKKVGEGEEQGEALVQQGSFSYTSPEGKLITIHYTADETGFHATGDHIPTPPPVSEEIQKGLDLIFAGIRQQEEAEAREAAQKGQQQPLSQQIERRDNYDRKFRK
ncbi:Endocuticle structural glycoprotein SgAbd-2 [Melipona quadrifasciata]|uniref:Endocuticle structural glycoprotein SgAbd-2 n=1 Tax=Melipona quadrifasciata TaxID=166423 RepID=A0A0N0U4R0_9HYME|nr:Endocuticle structural glycoprotein SgAbd-2 [Melipona quadrifasciata]